MSAPLKIGQPKLRWNCKLPQSQSVKNRYRNDPVAIRLREEGLTQDTLRILFSYDPDTGFLTHNLSRGVKKVGERAGSPNGGGYWAVHISGFGSIKAHRVIWCHKEGYFPEQEIDHENGDKCDNRWANLRLVSKSCNLRNSCVYATNSSGVKGVGWNKRTQVWVVRIESEGKPIYVGRHKDFTEAVCHRFAIEQSLNWNDCDANSSAYQYLKQQGIIK